MALQSLSTLSVNFRARFRSDGAAVNQCSWLMAGDHCCTYLVGVAYARQRERKRGCSKLVCRHARGRDPVLECTVPNASPRSKVACGLRGRVD